MSRPKTVRGSSAALGALLCTALLLPATAASADGTSTQGCQNTSTTLTVEENRLAAPNSIGSQILTASGMTPLTTGFLNALCGSLTLGAATNVVATQGTLLWKTAVDRAQGNIFVAGTLPGNDDRPLYWARLAMTTALRRWAPLFPLNTSDRNTLMSLLETTSRGMTTDLATSAPFGSTKFFVSGFDPFSLDADQRQGNPSGAAALALDGKTWTAPDGHVYAMQAVVFPVRWTDFDQGMVENVYRHVFTSGDPAKADMYATISQGRPGIFDLEVYNGRRRSSNANDNNNRGGGGSYTNPVVPPGMGAGPEFTKTTLPTAAMQSGAANRPFPVRVHTSVVEIPAGQTRPVTQPNGPTAGSISVEGGGGNYLSNEIAYRATRERDEVGTGVPGGHIHTPVLNFGSGNTTQITDPTFESNRTTIINQVKLLVEATH